MSSNYLLLVVAIASILVNASCASRQETPAADDARRFIADYETNVRPVAIELEKLRWTANATGKTEDFKAAEDGQNRLEAMLSDRQQFARLKLIRTALAANRDPILARQIDMLYLAYLGNQVDPALLRKMSAKANAITQQFNTYRAKVNGKELAASDVQKILKTSKDSSLRKAAWEGSKGVGAVVEADLKELVKLRNQAARSLGFRNYHDMQLQLNEQSQAEVLKLFDELDAALHEPFLKAKAEIDAKLAENCGISVEQLRPWHYHDPFFQESPGVFPVDFDSFYRNADVVKLCQNFYNGIGLNVDEILARSDLYERPGKYPHAQCCDMDREGDVRVMANVVPDESWMGTMLHELGHAVYCPPYIPKDVPYVLRGAAHTLTTEGLAMLMERFSTRPDFIQAMGIEVPDAEATAKAGATSRRNARLIFTAWSQVMFRFEMALYENPDQDLNKLWWDLVERYQGLKRPEGRNAPDYAAKIHIVSAPCYYHNYTLGSMFAAQLHEAIAREALKGDPRTVLYNGRPEVGAFLRKRVFAPGMKLRWDEFVKESTGESLSPKALLREIEEG